MNHAGKKIAFLFVFFFLVAGCFGPGHPDRKINYYALEYAVPEDSELKPLPYIIQVDRFQATPLFGSDKIVYRESEYRMDAYHYHKWRAAPADLVTCFLARDLRQSSLFQAVFTVDTGYSSTHAIEGSVDEFFEQDGENVWTAVISTSVTLIDKNEPDISKSVLFQKKYRETETLRQKNPTGLAEAMSTAMSRLSDTIVKDVYNRLSR